jgi:hypothetical protein
MALELTTVSQEIKVWYALRTEGEIFGNPYTEFVSAITDWHRDTIELPSGETAKLVEKNIPDDEDEDVKTFIIFSIGEKLYRMDGDDYDSWSSVRNYYTPYEVESKIVTETKYVRV